LPYPRNRSTSPGIKATPLTFLLDRIVRDDESGAEAALRIVRQFRQRGCMVVTVQESWLNGSPEIQDILIAFAGWMTEREPARPSERINAGLARRRAEGEAAGRRDGHGQAQAAGLRQVAGTRRRAARGGRAQVSEL
jgi:DNA invertase Pin-like site-specific DNA recombinase